MGALDDITASLTADAKSFAMRKVVDYVAADPIGRLPQALTIIDKLDVRDILLPHRKAVRAIIESPDNNWNQLIRGLWEDVDPEVLRTFLQNVVVNGSIVGYPIQQRAAEEHGCNVPWTMLIDPTSACNLSCKGCWAADYGDKLNLSFSELDRVIEEAKSLGIHVFLFSGGEPLVRKRDIMLLCQRHDDCEFFAFTNATLIDEELADEFLRVKNFVPIISVEGFEEDTDARRGSGTFAAVMRAMELLRERGILFGASCCYTSANAEVIGSERYIDFLIEQGAKFAWFFTYMPVGASAPTDLLATAEDRAFMYRQIRAFRETKPLFTMDFWNDGEFTQGCIAGGRRYLHINANGDIEPCAFIHYSDANIRDTPLLEALKRPLFMAYHDNQPFNGNHLRPCPVLDNKDRLAQMVEASGAHSTDLEEPEDAAALCAKTHAAADRWEPVAQRLWEEGHWTSGPNAGRRK